jgi:uncharacterized delta-60 repeat protein/uncharacterized repeat protein (TIGR01451 family)
MKNIVFHATLFLLLVGSILSNKEAYGQKRPADLDVLFNEGTGAWPWLFASAIQNDGKIVLGGAIAYYNGTLRNKVARVYPDGSVDSSFNANNLVNNSGGDIYSLSIQPDGKIFVTGSIVGPNITCLARLNLDGSLDTSFHLGSGTNATVKSHTIQPDGKIIIGGFFTDYNGTATNSIARLNTDGTIDPSFNIGSGFQGALPWVNAILVQPDGKIIVGGEFSSFNGTPQNGITRLNSNGSLDASFVTGTGFLTGTGAVGDIRSINLQSDGKIIIAGSYYTYNGFSSKCIVRLNANGSFDPSFNVGTSTGGFGIETTKLQPDGKILIGGGFTNYNGVPRKYLARINVDGSLDLSFDVSTGPDDNVTTITIQPDGKILVGGLFLSYKGVNRKGIVRLKGEPSYFNKILGKVYTDSNNDCIKQSTENTFSSLIVKAMPGPYYGGTDGNGNYKVIVDSGTVTYTLTKQHNTIATAVLIDQCNTSHTVNLNGAYKDTASFDFADSIKYCSLLNIAIQNTRMIRCFRNNTYVNYCNYGSVTASSAQITIEYPSHVTPISSIPMWTSKVGSLLTYDIGSIGVNQCGKIELIDSVNCGDISFLGLTECIKASISPTTNCLPINQAWDKSSIKVTGSCQNDSAQFCIENVGTGNMTGQKEFRVYVNDTLVLRSNFQLKIGEKFFLNCASEGQTIRVEADQHTFHPGKSRPRATLQNCETIPTSTPIKDFVTTVPLDDADLEIATTCNQIRGSYDPNDKLVIPAGIGPSMQIAPGEELEYTIRFQNTGTDVAYNIKVIDTLDANLDAASFIKGVSSHPYTLTITGKGQAVLAFNFYNINLPDKIADEAGSNGLISYKITLPASTPLGTVIKNKAYIYFDYNSPIITNETEQTVGITIEEDLSKGSKIKVGETISTISGIANYFHSYSVTLYPNPSSGTITLETPNSTGPMEFRISNILGVVQKTVLLPQARENQLNLHGLIQGVYLYELWESGMRKAGGMFQMK